MRHRLRAELTTETGSLQRLLITATKRCYEPVGMVANLIADSFVVELEVESDRSPCLLVRALERQLDVSRVELL